MTENAFQPGGLPVLIGSLPVEEHDRALQLVFDHTPEIPLWVQLPAYREEGMIFQFMPGLPGWTVTDERAFVDTEKSDFSDDLLAFYEEYMGVTEGDADLDSTRFALAPDMAKGFFVLLDHVKGLETPPAALKGQVTGPITFATAVKDQNGRALFYDDQMRDVAIKLLAQKARWQVKKLKQFGRPVIIFLDEPALAGFGSSEFISISKAEVSDALEEVIAAIHAEGGLAGVHVCANTEWDLVMDTAIDIVNFDAYSYFDKFVLYPDTIKKFLNEGRIIAWGIVPTSDAADIDRETPESLVERWREQAQKLEVFGFDRATLLNQTLISPSCGTGSLSLSHARRVLALTRAVSDQLRSAEL